MNMRLKIYELLAFPAHLWLMGVARLCGVDLEYGPTDDDGNITGGRDAQG